MDLRRINSLDLTVRSYHVCKAMGIKTAHGISKIDWDSLRGTKAKWYNKEGQFLTSYPINLRVVEELNKIKNGK